MDSTWKDARSRRHILSHENTSIYKIMALELASYNRWQNETLYSLCDDLGEESQITAALHRLGIDYGITDLPMNPLSRY